MRPGSITVFCCLCAAPVPAQASWSMLYPGTSPPPRENAVMACHDATGETLLLFGRSETDGWRLVGDDWQPLAGPLPPPRGYSQMVYDAERQQLVLFGGLAGSLLQDTWLWNGSSWSSPLLAVQPPARRSHGMAYDPDRGVTVLYGGNPPGSPPYLQDLWEWDGSSWTLIAATNPPGERSQPKLAFDPNTRTVLLHGGVIQVGNSGVYLNDTWSWDGTTWQQLQPATPPTLRTGDQMVSDTARERVLLFGGYTASSFAWEWDGHNWAIVVQASPTARAEHAMAYDPVARRVLLFGGDYGSISLNDTWRFATAQPATVEPFGSGCAGTAGVPALGFEEGGLPWLGDTLATVVTNVDAASLGALFVTGFASAAPMPLGAVGMPGCSLLLPADVIEFALAASGEASWQSPIPNDPALAGASFRQQAFPLDSAANALGVVASNAVEITTGVR